jgi:hypothetical protein
MNGNHARILGIIFVLYAAAFAVSQASNAPDPHSVPSVDGGAGPCTADFTVTDSNGAPLYLAKISVHYAYRFGGFHKMDLEISTNVDGKARFTGIPERTKHGLYFRGSQGNLEGEVFDDPANTCKAQFTLALQKKSQ